MTQKRTCLSCDTAVPSPWPVCLKCGGRVLLSYPTGDRTVKVPDIPSQSQRQELVKFVAERAVESDPREIESRLASQSSSLFGGLDLETATDLQARLKKMNVSSQVAFHDTKDVSRSGFKTPTPYAVFGAFAVAAFWWPYALVLGAALAVILGATLSKNEPSTLAIPATFDPAVDGPWSEPTALAEAIRSLPEATRNQLGDIMSTASHLLELADKDEFVAQLFAGSGTSIHIAVDKLLTQAYEIAVESKSQGDDGQAGHALLLEYHQAAEGLANEFEQALNMKDTDDIDGLQKRIDTRIQSVKLLKEKF